MKEVVKNEIISYLKKANDVISVKQSTDLEELRELSDHAIEDVAALKDLDLIAVTVLLYSIYKIGYFIKTEEYISLKKYLNLAIHHLEENSFGRYNSNIKELFKIVKGCNAKVEEHFSDVMQAARIKKGSILLQKGLSMGQAAGLMGLSNWDLQAYAGKTTALGFHTEKIPAKKRLLNAFKIFGVKNGGVKV